MLILMIMSEDLRFELILIFVKVHNKVLNEFPKDRKKSYYNSVYGRSL